MGLKKVQKQGRDENTKTILVQKNHGKERLEDYSTSVAGLTTCTSFLQKFFSP